MNRMNKMIILSALTIVIFSTIVSAISVETFDLIADGGDEYLDVGDVTVWDDGTNIYVSYTTADDWCINETHLHIATSVEAIPQTKKGNPIPGKFDYFTDHDPEPCITQVDYTIPIPDGCEPGDEVIIAAHAAVQLELEQDIFRYETAWGEGLDFEGKNWATYFTYEIVD